MSKTRDNGDGSWSRDTERPKLESRPIPGPMTTPQEPEPTIDISTNFCMAQTPKKPTGEKVGYEIPAYSFPKGYSFR